MELDVNDIVNDLLRQIADKSKEIAMLNAHIKVLKGEVKDD